jgi:hypothetical protein
MHFVYRVVRARASMVVVQPKTTEYLFVSDYSTIVSDPATMGLSGRAIGIRLCTVYCIQLCIVATYYLCKEFEQCAQQWLM